MAAPLVFHGCVDCRIGAFVRGFFLVLAAAGCHREQSSAAPQEEGCTGARCVEQAEAAMYYGDYMAAREPLVTACELGDGFQCDRLAQLWHHGQGGPVNLVTAAKYYEEGCAKEFPEACERRALLAAEGSEPAVELDYWIKACEGRRQIGCVRAGQQLSAGRGVDKDIEKAVSIYQSGCDLGDIDGCNGAGDLLLADPRGKADAKTRALAAFVSACVGHSGYGCLKVGVALHNGVGAPVDLEKARMHFTKACEWNEQDGCHAAKQLEGSKGKPVVLELTSKAEQVGIAGLETRMMTCRMNEQGPTALGDMVGRLARFKGKLDECAENGAAVRVSWEFERGKVKEARARGKAYKTNKCVTDLLKKMRMPTVGNCDAVLLLGDPEGASKSLEALQARMKAAKEKEQAGHIQVSEEDE